MLVPCDCDESCLRLRLTWCKRMVSGRLGQYPDWFGCTGSRHNDQRGGEGTRDDGDHAAHRVRRGHLFDLVPLLSAADPDLFDPYRRQCRGSAWGAYPDACYEPRRRLRRGILAHLHRLGGGTWCARAPRWLPGFHLAEPLLDGPDRRCPARRARPAPARLDLRAAPPTDATGGHRRYTGVAVVVVPGRGVLRRRLVALRRPAARRDPDDGGRPGKHRAGDLAWAWRFPTWWPRSRLAPSRR